MPDLNEGAHIGRRNAHRLNGMSVQVHGRAHYGLEMIAPMYGGATKLVGLDTVHLNTPASFDPVRRRFYAPYIV